MARDDTGAVASANSDNDFWRFSLAVYGAEGVAAECLSLQDACGVDVNVLLFCAWLGARGFELRRQDIEAAVKAVAGWQDNVVRPLRSARRFTKADGRDEVFRKSLKEIEIKAEQIEQSILFSLSSQMQSTEAIDRRTAVAQNIKEYIAGVFGAEAGERSAKSTQRLVEAALRFR